jgi:hypothetical protein
VNDLFLLAFATRRDGPAIAQVCNADRAYRPHLQTPHCVPARFHVCSHTRWYVRMQNRAGIRAGLLIFMWHARNVQVQTAAELLGGANEAQAKAVLSSLRKVILKWFLTSVCVCTCVCVYVCVHAYSTSQHLQRYSCMVVHMRTHSNKIVQRISSRA